MKRLCVRPHAVLLKAYSRRNSILFVRTAFIFSCTQIISMDFTNTSPAQLGIIIADGGPHKNAALAALVQTAERADEAVRVAHAAVEAAVALLRNNNRYDLLCCLYSHLNNLDNIISITHDACDCDCTQVGHQLNGEIGASDCPASPSTKWPCRSGAGRDWKAGMGLIHCVMELYMIIGLIGNGTTLPPGITG